jgi:DNA-binding GntR family transcriptional regulator
LGEALKVLYAEGLIFLLPNRSSGAAKLTTEDLQDLFDGSIKTDVRALSGEVESGIPNCA